MKGKLASYKAPEYYEFVDELPRNYLGKVLKTELRKQYGQATGAADQGTYSQTASAGGAVIPAFLYPTASGALAACRLPPCYSPH